MTAHPATAGPLVATEPIVAPDGPPPDGPAAQGPAADGPAADGPAPDGPAAGGAAAAQEAPGSGAEPELRHPGPSLSPSRAADFKTCPLLFRFRTIDRLPERPSADQLRGTLVHAVLERLFDLPAAERTPQAAADLVAPQWQRLVDEQPELAAVFAEPVRLDPPAGPPSAADTDADAPSTAPAGVSGSGRDAASADEPVPDGVPADEPVPDAAELTRRFLESAGGLLDGYFAVEDPRRLEPAERETLISTLVDGQLLIRGYIDRLDVSPAGDLRVVDYKTGGAPREAFEARALFQLKFYALVLWRTRGVVPRVLRLLYLKDAQVCDYQPDAEELERFERTLVALWRAIERATAAGDFRPRPSRLCGWCNHQQYCPSFGGTPPPMPAPRSATGASAETGATAGEEPGQPPMPAPRSATGASAETGAAPVEEAGQPG